MKLALSLLFWLSALPVQTDSDISEQISEVSDSLGTVIPDDLNLLVMKWGEPLTCHHDHDLYSNLKERSLIQFVHCPKCKNNLVNLLLATKDDVENLNVNEVYT